MHDLTPEQLERLESLAAARDKISLSMDAYIASIGTDDHDDPETFGVDSEMLRAVSLEFMDHATALVEAARERDQLIGERFAMRGEIEELRTLVANLTRRSP